MARYTGADCRLCRREKMKLFLKGPKCDTMKCPIERRPYPPGEHGRDRPRESEYQIQLREKQKARRIYGVLEKQFRNLYEEANRNQGITGSNNIPLGNRRRFGGDDEAGGYNPSAPAEGLSELKRGRSPERGKCNARHHYRRTLTNSLQLPTVPDSARSATDGVMLARTKPLVLWACPQLSTRP